MVEGARKLIEIHVVGRRRDGLPAGPDDVLGELGDELQIVVVVALQPDQLPQAGPVIGLRRGAVLILHGGDHRMHFLRGQPEQREQRGRDLLTALLQHLQAAGEDAPLPAARFAELVAGRDKGDKSAAIGQRMHQFPGPGDPDRHALHVQEADVGVGRQARVGPHLHREIPEEVLDHFVVVAAGITEEEVVVMVVPQATLLPDGDRGWQTAPADSHSGRACRQYIRRAGLRYIPVNTYDPASN